jgi:hypothetical protein
VRRMRKVHCPGSFRIVPWDSRFYALFQEEELICVTVYKTGARKLMNRLYRIQASLEQLKRTLPAALAGQIAEKRR